MDIQWYPGHMAKTRRLLTEKLKLIDIALLAVDARAPYSTFNPELRDLLAGKACVVVLNKRDLADEAASEAWAAYFRAQMGAAVCFSAAQDKKGRLMEAIGTAAAPIRARYAQKGMKKTIRVLVAGIPNVGKSAIINRLAGRRSAREGNRPGVTRGLQWVRLGEHLEMMDSPGLLWPKIGSEQAAVRIALCGCIRQEIMDLQALAMRLIEILADRAPEAISERYGTKGGLGARETLADICRRRGFLAGQGELDIARGAKTLLDEFMEGRLGRISLELPQDIAQPE